MRSCGRLRDGILARARPAMRFLHAGNADRGARHRAAAAGRQRAPDQGRAFRQPVPLHRLSRHRQCGPCGDRALGATPAATAGATAAPAEPLVPFEPTDSGAATTPATAKSVAALEEPRKGWTRFEESFVIVKPPAAVWEVFADVPAVAACLTGAELTEYDGQTAKGTMTVKLGPILAGFSRNPAVIERDEATLRGVIRGAGNVKGIGSRQGRISPLRLAPKARQADPGRAGGRVQPARRARPVLALEPCTRTRPSSGCRFRRQAQRPACRSRTAKSRDAPLNVGRLAWLWLSDRLRRAFGR